MSSHPFGKTGGIGSGSTLNVDPHDKPRTESWAKKGDIVMGNLQEGAGSAGTGTGEIPARNIANPMDYVDNTANKRKKDGV
jgi:hypothetical protein